MTDHRAKFYADWLLHCREIRNWTGKKETEKESNSRLYFLYPLHTNVWQIIIMNYFLLMLIMSHTIFVLLFSSVDKKPPPEVTSNPVSSVKLHDRDSERSLNRRLGIRDLPMPPMPFDADDDVDDDETDEHDLQKKEDDLFDSIVKSFAKNKQVSTSRADTCQQPQQQYVLNTIISFIVCDSSLNLIIWFYMTLRCNGSFQL